MHTHIIMYAHTHNYVRTHILLHVAHAHSYMHHAYICMHPFAYTCTHALMHIHAHTHMHVHIYTIHTCTSGLEVAIALMVSEPMTCTMLLNFSVSMFAISRAFVISSSFCSLTYVVSASLALVNLSNSDCYNKGT